MDPDLMTEEELAKRDRVMITCTGCGQTYGYAVGDLNPEKDQQSADIAALVEYVRLIDAEILCRTTDATQGMRNAIQPELPEA